MKCGAKCRNGHPCRKWPIKGRNRCRLHGGKTLVGSANGLYKHGRHSKYLPARLAERYETAKDDPELLSLKDEIGVVDARLMELLTRVDTGESGAVWRALRRDWDAFTRAQAAQDIPGMHRAVAHIEDVMSRGLTDYAAWREIGELIEQRRKLVESEAKRLMALRQLLTVEEALQFAQRIVDVVTRHCPDKHILSAIIVDLQLLMQAQGPLSALSEEERC